MLLLSKKSFDKSLSTCIKPSHFPFFLQQTRSFVRSIITRCNRCKNTPHMLQKHSLLHILLLLPIIPSPFLPTIISLLKLYRLFAAIPAVDNSEYQIKKHTFISLFFSIQRISSLEQSSQKYKSNSTPKTRPSIHDSSLLPPTKFIICSKVAMP